MNTRTHTLPLAASKAKAFELLANIENLPKWATVFCRQLKCHPDGTHTVVTPQGEIYFRIVGDRNTGVIDMFGGPTEEQMAYWPARVIDLPTGGSLFMFTALQYPGLSDSEFERQCDGLKQEFVHIRDLVDGPGSQIRELV